MLDFVWFVPFAVVALLNARMLIVNTYRKENQSYVPLVGGLLFFYGCAGFA